MTELLTPPLYIVFILAIVILHILAASLKKRHAASVTLTAINAALHIAFIIYLLIEKASPKKLFLALLISTAVSLITTRVSTNKEDKDGI